MLILTVRLVVEDQLHSCGDIGEDIKGEDDDDQEGPEVTEAIHDCVLVEEEYDDKSQGVEKTNTEDQEDEPLFLSKDDIPE